MTMEITKMHVRRATRTLGTIAGGVLAVGLGLGAALAAPAGIASADDFQISIDGFDLFPTTGNTATAISGLGDIAIAYGAGSHAIAEGGFGDFATAASGATAIAGDITPGATGNNFDFASATAFIDIGSSDAIAAAGNVDGAPDSIGSSFDSAIDVGGSGGSGTSAIAGDNGSFDSALVFGYNGEAHAGESSIAADPSNFDSASVLSGYHAPTMVVGNEADAGGGSDDTAFVIDPSGTMDSNADAGEFGSFDLAGVLGDGLHANLATGANFLTDILS
jgi:hypothetical protein